MIANIAIPSGIQLVGQTRTRLLKSAKAYDPEQVAQEEEQAQQVRRWTDDLKDPERLLARVEHLRRIVAWADELQERLGIPQPDDCPRQRFDEALALAHRILDQNDYPDQKDKVRSVYDPDARRGKHGDYFDGYQLDISLDADSELITQLETPPANQDEAANAENLIESEEQVHGNDVVAISLDAIGIRGEILRTLKNPRGLGLEVYVPPREWSSYQRSYFTPEDFHLEEEGQLLICPAEQETRTRRRSNNNTGWQFEFKRSQCKTCPLLAGCMATMHSNHGRKVIKNDYESEYRTAREPSQDGYLFPGTTGTSKSGAQVRRDNVVPRGAPNALSWPLASSDPVPVVGFGDQYQAHGEIADESCLWSIEPPCGPGLTGKINMLKKIQTDW